MKRFFAVVLLLAISSTANAEPIKFTAGSRVGEILEFIVSCAGFAGVRYDEGAEPARFERLGSTVTVEGCKGDREFREAIGKILPIVYSPYLDLEGNLHIKLIAPRPRTVVPDPDYERPAQLAVQPIYPYRNDFWMQPTPHGLTTQQRSEWYRLRRMRPDYDPCMYGDYGCDYSGGVSVTRTGMVYGPSLPYMVPLNEGSMKTTGDTRGVELYVEGCYVGGANQFDSWWDQKAPLLSGHALTITARKKDRAYSRTTVVPNVWSGRIAGNRHLPFTIDDYYFSDKESFPFDGKAMETACRNSPLATSIR